MGVGWCNCSVVWTCKLKILGSILSLSELIKPTFLLNRFLVTILDYYFIVVTLFLWRMYINYTRSCSDITSKVRTADKFLSANKKISFMKFRDICNQFRQRWRHNMNLNMKWNLDCPMATFCNDGTNCSKWITSTCLRKSLYYSPKTVFKGKESKFTLQRATTARAGSRV